MPVLKSSRSKPSVHRRDGVNDFVGVTQRLLGYEVEVCVQTLLLSFVEWNPADV